MKPVVWGVLSTAKIGMQHVIPAMLSSPLVELRGILFFGSLFAFVGLAYSLYPWVVIDRLKNDRIRVWSVGFWKCMVDVLRLPSRSARSTRTRC
mgnify:CR=1 FL=1